MVNVLNATELYTLEWSLVRYVNVTSINPAAALAPSILASQPQPGPLPLPGPYPFEAPERGDGDGVIHDVSGYFLSPYLPESVSSPPHSLALLATGWGNVATGPCSFSNGEVGPSPLPSAEAGLAPASFDGWKSTEPAGKACPSSRPP